MLTFIFALLMSVPLPDRPTRYVTDTTGMLDRARTDALNERLAEFERQTSDQVLVYVAGHIPEGTTLEEMSAEAMKTWGVGQKGKDNGAILFIFTTDRKMRIEVGYGLEGSLTDAKSKDILSTIVKPRLRNGDLNGAVEDGANAMLATIRGESYAGSGATVAEQVPAESESFLERHAFGFLKFMVIVAILAIGSLTRNRKRYGVAGGSSDSSSSGSDWSSSSSYDSSSSSSSSSSDFSGGGGSSGGGGASDSW